MSNLFDRQQKQMDKAMRRMIWLSIMSAVLGISLLGFGVWCIVKLMQHNGVI